MKYMVFKCDRCGVVREPKDHHQTVTLSYGEAFKHASYPDSSLQLCRECAEHVAAAIKERGR